MSGGNKRRRKKCHWNICHLGINVIQSYDTYKFPQCSKTFPVHQQKMWLKMHKKVAHKKEP